MTTYAPACDWTKLADEAVRDWHRRQRTIDSADEHAQPLTLREHFSHHKLERVVQTLVGHTLTEGTGT